MKKKLLYALLALVVLTLGGAGLVIWNLNPIIESFRPTITAKLSEAIKAEVELGALEVSLFPTTAVQIRDVGLAGEQNRDALHIKQVTLETDLWGLLKKQLHVSDLKVNGVRVVATRSANGQLSIGSLPLGKKQQSPPRPTSGAPNSTAPDSAAPIDSRSPGTAVTATPTEPQKNAIELAVKSAMISDATLVWDDKLATPPQLITLSDLKVSLAEITQNSVGRFSLSATGLGQGRDNIKLTGTSHRREGAALPDAESSLEIANVDLKRVQELLLAYGLKMDGLTLTDSLSFKAAVKASGGTFAIDTTLDATKAGIQVASLFDKLKDLPFTVTSNSSATMLGQIDASKVELRLGEATIQLPVTASFLSQSAKGAVKTTNLPLAALAATLPMLRPYALDGTVTTDLAVAVTSESPPAITGTVDLAGVKADVQLGAAGSQPPLRISGLTGKLALEEDSLLAKPIELKLADQPFSIGAKITGIKSANHAVQLALKSEKLALDPLLAALMAGGVPALHGSTLETLQLALTYNKAARNGGATITIDRGTVAGLPLAAAKLSADFALDAENKPAAVTLKPSTLGIFGGTLSLQGTLAGEVASAQVRGSGLDLTKMLAVANPNSKVKVTGTLKSLSADVRGNKNSFGATVSGPVRASVSEGVVTGANILKQVFEKIDTIPGLGVAALSYVPERYRSIVQSDSTEFRSIEVDAAMESGTARINDFTLTNELYILSGQGTIVPGGSITLNTQLKLTPLLAESIVLREPKAKLLLDSNNNIVIPVVIRKNGDGPVIALPDVSRLLKMGAKNTAKEAATKALDKVAPGLGGALNSIFK